MSARCRIACLLSAVLLSAGVGRAGESKLEQRVYAVSDLVIAVKNVEKNDKTAAPSYCWMVSGKTKPGNRIAKGAATCEDRLIKLITNTIAPRSWAEQGGPGTIDYHPLTMALVINQTPDVQDQIADLLAALRRLHDMEVSVEVRFVTITKEMLADLQQKGLLGEQDKKKHSHGNVTFLDDGGVMRFMEAIQGDMHTNVMQAPKMTMFNGQNATFNATDEQFFVTGLEIAHCDDHIEYRPKTETIPLGVRMSLRPVVSADRRFVQLHLDAKMNDLVSSDVPLFPITTPVSPREGYKEAHPRAKPEEFTQYIQQPQINKLNVKRTLVIPDGHTAVLTGLTKKCMGTNKYGPPILSEIPLLGNLFCTVTHQCETHHLLVLVTPRIHVEVEKEEKPSTKPSCGKATMCPCGGKEDGGTPILPSVRDDETVQGEEPSEARILRALPRTARLPGIVEESRDSIQIVKERIVDKVDPPRFFPLVGPARLHHCHWKCTVYYNETICGTFPFTFRYTRPRIEVVYIDSDHLHLVDSAR
jgi:hypothetical protein